MKKLILLGVVLTALSLSTQAQLNVNINIGAEPRYAPIGYTTTTFYAPVRPVYVTNRYVKVAPSRNHYTTQRSYYKSRPVVYKELHYKKHKGNKYHYKTKGKGKKHRR